MGNKKYVFISYSSKESDQAYLVKKTLEENGIHCWMAPESIPGGSDYTNEIPKAISGARAIVLVFSSKAQDSQYVYSEMKLAQKYGKVIIPFAIENCDITKNFDFIISRNQRIQAFEEQSDALKSLIKVTHTTIRKIDEKQKKRLVGIFSAVLVLVFALVGVYIYHLSQTGTASGVTGDCQWSFDKTALSLVVSGEGQMDNYTEDTPAPWHRYLSDAAAITIEDGVTAVGDYAFTSCAATEITIADSVTLIGSSAFADCAFKEVILPQNLERIGEEAFRSCTELEEIAFPESLLAIDDYAFSYCDSLLVAHLPDYLTHLGVGAFAYCKNMAAAVVTAKIITVPDKCFEGCESLTGVTLYEGLEEIGESCFSGCDLYQTWLPTTIKRIDAYAFYGCERLVNQFLYHVDLVGEYAFLNAGGDSVFVSDANTVFEPYAVGFIEDSDATPVKKDSFTIHCPKGSYAQSYAERYGLPLTVS